MIKIYATCTGFILGLMYGKTITDKIRNSILLGLIAFIVIIAVTE